MESQEQIQVCDRSWEASCRLRGFQLVTNRVIEGWWVGSSRALDGDGGAACWFGKLGVEICFLLPRGNSTWLLTLMGHNRTCPQRWLRNSKMGLRCPEFMFGFVTLASHFFTLRKHMRVW